MDSNISHTSSQFSPKTKRANHTETINTVIPTKIIWMNLCRVKVRRPNNSMNEKAHAFIT